VLFIFNYSSYFTKAAMRTVTAMLPLWLAKSIT